MHVKVHLGGVVFAEVFKGVYSTIHLYYILHRGQLLESKSTMYATFRCIPFCLARVVGVSRYTCILLG